MSLKCSSRNLETNCKNPLDNTSLHIFIFKNKDKNTEILKYLAEFIKY